MQEGARQETPYQVGGRIQGPREEGGLDVNLAGGRTTEGTGAVSQKTTATAPPEGKAEAVSPEPVEPAEVLPESAEEAPGRETAPLETTPSESAADEEIEPVSLIAHETEESPAPPAPEAEATPEKSAPSAVDILAEAMAEDLPKTETTEEITSLLVAGVIEDLTGGGEHVPRPKSFAKAEETIEPVSLCPVPEEEREPGTPKDKGTDRSEADVAGASFRGHFSAYTRKFLVPLGRWIDGKIQWNENRGLILIIGSIIIVSISLALWVAGCLNTTEGLD
ncbi:MAG: hypothetical protein V1918_00145 [Planctomycetota bacterium]